MSIHLVECAANLPLPPSTKLALMAFADSADRHTHLAMPGLEQVMRWASVGRSRAAEIVAELADLQLLDKHAAGHRGRRAEYVVFPNGCCAEHIRPPADDSDDDSRKGSAGPESMSGNASGGPDPMPPGGNGSSRPDPFSGKGSDTPDSTTSLRPTGPITHKGSGKGPVASGPLPSVNNKPPHPPAAAGGDSHSCSKPGPTPHANCRGCGTTNRQIQQAERKAAAERKRLQDLEQLRERQERTRAQAVATQERSAAAAMAIAEARATFGKARRTV